MAVDPTKTRIILVVHGVQAGRDEEITSHETVKQLVLNRLGGTPIDFETKMYRYENLNDEAKNRMWRIFELILKHLTDEIPFGGLLGKVVEQGVDVVGDVVIKLSEGSTARTIRDSLIEKIKDVYQAGNPLYLLAHSLGSIYAFDAVNELMKDRLYFDRNSRKTWPVQALVTVGSPIGLSIFKRNRVQKLGEGRHYFRWVNFWARTDPVVSGSFYGKPRESYQIAERFSTDSDRTGWVIQDKIVDTGKTWLAAHTGYWDHPGVGDDLVTLIAS
jgi:hypothetical protein